MEFLNLMNNNEDDDDDDEEEEEEEEEDFKDFEEYMNFTSSKDFRVINHKTDNLIIHYLFQDNQNPPQYQWISGAGELSRDQKSAIQQYWIMQTKIDKCGLPRRPKDQVQIISPYRVKREKDDGKVLYAVQTPQLPIEFFTANDFKNGLKGKKTLTPLIDFYEKSYFTISNE